jgi:hypothetical protein
MKLRGKIAMMKRALSILRIAIAWAVVSSFSGGALAQAQRAPSAAPVMTEELMARLIKYIRSSTEDSSLSARVCKVLDLCDGTAAMQLRLAKSDSTDGGHYFGIRPEEAAAKDIFIAVMREKILEVYLTDKTGKLRAAAVEENGIARLITNENAAAKFKVELALFAKEAAEQLPPSK